MRRFLLTLMILAAGLAFLLTAAEAQKAPSAKDLVKQAEADQKADRWEAAREKLKLAAAQKPKDKSIAEALKLTEETLADRAAARAVAFCDRLEIDKCEKEVNLATSYARTQRAQDAETRLATRKKAVQDQWNQAQQKISGGQLAEAAADLDYLGRFSYLFPTLAAEKERVRQLRVAAFLAEAAKNISAQRWDAAMDSFTAALRMDPNNNEATRGLESAKLEKEVSTAFQQAQNAFGAKAYQVAYEANQKALKLFPVRRQYQDLAKQIATDWVKVLMEDSRRLSANADSMKDNQKALEALEWVRRLEPRHAGLPEELRVVRVALHSIYIQKATEYQNVADNSRIGIAYLYYLNAQQSNPGGEFAFAAKLREVSGLFARKRAFQMLVNVENLSPATPAFAEVISRRVRAVIDKLGLPDVKLRTLDDYQKNPAEDPQFVENRPDGKSPTALLTVALTNYESENTGNDKPVEKPSKFVSGQETVPNPAYEQIQAEFSKISAALAREKPKPGRTTKEGYSSQDLVIRQQQMTTTPRDISRDKISDYTYQEFQLSVRALVKMNLEIRDMLEKQLLGNESVEATDQRSQVETAGVREKDVNNLINRPARLPSSEALLRDCERKGIEALDDKVKRLVTQYLQRFYSEGEKALREGRAEDALENLLCHWYSFRGRVDESQSQRIRDLVKLATGFELSATGTVPAGL